jgi:hypothetical protein
MMEPSINTSYTSLKVSSDIIIQSSDYAVIHTVIPDIIDVTPDIAGVLQHKQYKAFKPYGIG